MQSVHFVLDTKNPLGNPSGIRVSLCGAILATIAAEAKIAKSITIFGRTDLFIFPLFILILPMIYPMKKWFDLNIKNRKICQPLMEVVTAEQLVDYEKDQTTVFGIRKVKNGVLIKVNEDDYNIHLQFIPRGIKRSDAVYDLTQRLTEAFNMTAEPEDGPKNAACYRLVKTAKQQIKVTNDDFLK